MVTVEPIGARSVYCHESTSKVFLYYPCSTDVRHPRMICDRVGEDATPDIVKDEGGVFMEVEPES